MRVKLITMMINTLLMALSPELLKTAVDALLDIIENAVAKSPTTIDDKIVLPLVSLIRDTFGIDDNDVPAPTP